MSDIVNIGSRVQNLDVASQFAPYSKVIIHIDNETAIEVGDNSGRTLEVDNPFGTQTMAQNMLTKLRGYQYQPYTAKGALLDPAAEIGDALSSPTNYGGIYSRNYDFGRLMKANVSAPADQEIDHEYTYVSSEERQFARETKDIRASLTIQANMIQAEVSARESAINELSTSMTQTADEIRAEAVAKTGGTASSFGWSLLASGFKLYSGGANVFEVTPNGAYINGTIRATAGFIGGFTIGGSAITYNGLEYGATDKNTGIYIGTRGIQLGKSFQVNNSGGVTASNLVINGGSIAIGNNFRVDSAGNVSAVNMTLSGTLNIGGRSITAEQLQQGAASAYSNGGYWSGGAAGGYNFSSAQSASSPASSFFANTIGAYSQLAVYQNAAFRCYGSFYKNNTLLSLKTKTINGTTINYLGW
jgi:hypothetical protein